MKDFESNKKYIYLLNVVKAVYGYNANIQIKTNSRVWRGKLMPYVCCVTTSMFDVWNMNTLVGANSLEEGLSELENKILIDIKSKNIMSNLDDSIKKNEVEAEELLARKEFLTKYLMLV